jgi:serpin B
MKPTPALLGSLLLTSLLAPAAAPSDLESAALANNAFAGDLYQDLAARNEGKNLFFSPFSISSALGMTWEGARGATAAEMATVLHVPAADGKPWANARVHAAAGALSKKFNQPDQGFELVVANALWAEKSMPLRQEFLANIQPNYDAKLATLDFITAPEAARKQINTWVEEKTKERIKDLLPDGSIDSDTRLVLTNAIYFKASWPKEFNQALTAEQPFQLAAGRAVKVPTMHDPAVHVGRHKADGFEVVELNYQGAAVVMTIVLPDAADGLPVIEKALTPGSWKTWAEALKPTLTDLYLPKFKLETDYSLNEPLKQLGMPLAFGGKADFSGITESGSLAISEVIHKAFVEVDEKGTEAAAATAVVISRASAMIEPEEPKLLRIDRPFLFALRDRDSGTVLFLGRVTDPR